MSRLATPYVPRQPQQTVLFGLVQEHLQDFFRHAREAYDGPLPKYVKDEFRKAASLARRIATSAREAHGTSL